MPNTWFFGTTALEKLPENESIVSHKDIKEKEYVYDDAREINGDLR